MKFEDLGLAEPILRALAAEGYTTPTPIQAKAIPHVLAGKDVLGVAQTGTGKTAAFALPIIDRLAKSKPRASHGHAAHPVSHHGHGSHQHHQPRHPARPLRALILAPTRELAAQIGDSFRAYGAHAHLRHAVIFGGVNQNPQTRALRDGVDILVATPGRLLDLMNQRYVDLRTIEIFVLDEADRMLDMGFIHDIRKIVLKLPTTPHPQTLLFSATMPPDIRALADTVLRNPVSVQVAPVSATADRIDQCVYYVDKRNKPVLLTHILQNTSYKRALVFTRTKHGADRVAKHLHREGIEAAAIHGNKSQSQRLRALEGFRSGKVPVLIASDIAARGIDIDEISHVINFDLPNVPETYVHRIGRTARAGAEGEAISFCDHEEKPYLKDIERLTRVHLKTRSDHPPYPTRAEHDAATAHHAPRPTRGPARPHAKPHGGHPQRGQGQSRTGQGAGHANTHAPRGGQQGGRGSGSGGATSGGGSRQRRRRRW